MIKLLKWGQMQLRKISKRVRLAQFARSKVTAENRGWLKREF